MGYDMYTLVSKDDFHTNIWGMGRLRELMDQANVLDCFSNHPDWPDSSKAYEADWDEKHPDVIKYEEQADEIRSSLSPEEGKVPIYKFGSNDGWVVTPEGCYMIAEAVSRYLDENPEYGLPTEIDSHEHRSFYKEWAEFNRKAAELGGYKVW